MKQQYIFCSIRKNFQNIANLQPTYHFDYFTFLAQAKRYHMYQKIENLICAILKLSSDSYRFTLSCQEIAILSLTNIRIFYADTMIDRAILNAFKSTPSVTIAGDDILMSSREFFDIRTFRTR